jgi:hypothetical protein
MIHYTLTRAEMGWAKQIAQHRQSESERKGLRDSHGFNGLNGIDLHLLGCVGELAVARMLNQEWDATVNTFKAPDQAGIVQVKTRSNHTYELLVRPDDKDNEIFVLVTCENFYNCRIHGWLWGRDAKKDEWKQKHGGRPAAWFAPHEALNPIDTLIAEVAQHKLAA